MEDFIMKIMLMTDMEGSAGIINHADWCLPTSRYYEKGKRLVTEEVNAAADGLFAAGATEIIVVDGHGHGGLDVELLDERTIYQCGHFDQIFPFGLDASFDALAVIGQHAKSNTDYSHITHTGSFRTLEMKVNNISIGEYGGMALCAMELGIPTILACGEKALCDEAEELTPGVITATVKWGILKDGLIDYTTDEYAVAKLTARHLSPLKARKVIRAAAEKAGQKLKESSDSFKYPELKPPYTLDLWLRDNPNGETEFHFTHPESIIELRNLMYK
jgi:D-amino peptidase